MNQKQLEYAILLSQERSFSKASEKLAISQPALSKQILSLENELGIKLFDRNSIPLKLTSAGTHFISEARDLLYKEQQLLRSMEKYKSGEAGELVIGITPFRSAYLVSETIKKVREKFPDIKVTLCEEGSETLRKEAAEGKFDFAIVNLPVDDTVLDVRELEADRLVLVLPKQFEDKYPELVDKKEIEFEDLRDLPFAVVSENQEMRRLFDRLCAAAGFEPDIAVQAVSLTTAWAMANAGVAATLLPWQFVAQNGSLADVKILELKNAQYVRQPVIVTKRGQYMTRAAAYAIAVLMEKKK